MDRGFVFLHERRRFPFLEQRQWASVNPSPSPEMKCLAIIVVVSLSLVLSNSLVRGQTSCYWRAPNGKTYDLAPLARINGKYTGFAGSSFSYALNFCTAAVTPSCPGQPSSVAWEITSESCKSIAPADAPPSFSFKYGNDDTAGIIVRFYGTNGMYIKYELMCGTNEYPTEPFTVKYIYPYYLVAGLTTKYACAVQSNPPSPSPTLFPDTKCTWTAPDGLRWDFSTLAKRGSFYTAADSTNYKYFVNFCTDVASPTCTQTGYAGFEYLTSCRTIAQLKSPVFSYVNGGSPRDGILLQYKSGGTACSPSPTLNYKFVCGSNRTPSEPLPMAYSYDGIKCQYTVTVTTSLACGSE